MRLASLFPELAKNQQSMKKTLLTFSALVVILVGVWGILTWSVQKERPARVTTYGFDDCTHQALIVYNPDPMYNLDEQVCRAFAKGLVSQNWTATVATVSGAKQLNPTDFNLLVVCANTYNFAPDKVVMNYIAEHNLTAVKAVGMVVGSGTTEQAKKRLQAALAKARVELLSMEDYWLLRPNDETAPAELSNVEVAIQQAQTLGSEIGNWR